MGNIRITYKKNSTYNLSIVLQQNDYYPFGMQIQLKGGGTQKYIYNDKELQDDLDWYDYGARMYDAALGRFQTVDPMAEKLNFQSPYVYAANNPIRFIDFNGLYPKSVLVYDPNIGLYGGYRFTQSAATLLSLVSGVSRFYVENAIIQERAAGQYRPFYSSNKGGGAITLGTSGYGASITYTQNWFEDDASKYNNHGYGQNVYAWLALSSHEVGHIPQIDEAGGLLSYVGGMVKEYAKSGHDDAPSEKEADEGYKNFVGFNYNTPQK
jgi:RHS repeat-associated protein